MRIKTRQELIGAYIDFFKSKDHKEIPSASLIPENDPTVLFTTAGMHSLVPYLQGQKHPLGTRLVNVQKCIRTRDIEKVGDEVHLTFFEMFGNWSLGNYWKKEAIEYSFSFLTKVLGFEIDKLAVSVFVGDEQVKRDEESALVWRDLGFSEERIAFLGRDDNWWGPAGETGPCGPDTEIFCWMGEGEAPKKFERNNSNWVEIGNNVFMQYEKTKDGKYLLSKQKNVDFGGGVERILAVLNNFDDVYQTSIFRPIIKKIEEISEKPYEQNEKHMRIIADHIRSATFILGDDHQIKPSNLGQGYVLRRIIRRAIRYGRILGIKDNFIKKIAEFVIQNYRDYPELEKNKETIFKELGEEEKKFSKTIEKGMKKFNEILTKTKEKISGAETFLLFQSYGFPVEMTQEIAEEKGKKVDLQGFEEQFKEHQKLSRTASAGIFKSGLADDSEQTTKLHTATHLLNEAIRRVLKNKEVKQRGSNISQERLRFDFNFGRKPTQKELTTIELLVNEKISQGLHVIREEKSLQDAIDSGAQAEFGAKYPDVVSVYTISDPTEKKGWFSKEICTGPHVRNTKEIGTFKIIHEGSVAAGVRRIKAIVE